MGLEDISQSKTVKVDQLVNNTIEVHKSVMTPVGGWLNEWRLTAHN
jgi:hypothetical protein